MYVCVWEEGGKEGFQPIQSLVNFLGEHATPDPLPSCTYCLAVVYKADNLIVLHNIIAHQIAVSICSYHHHL